MSSISTQSVAQLGGAASVLVRQRRDHVELDRLLEQVQRVSGEEQDQTLTRIWQLVFPHAYAEETVLWPAVRAALPDGDELTVQVEKEHQQVNELASVLDRMPRDQAGRGELVEQVVALLREDVRDEEDVLLPRLQEALSPRQLRRIGRSWELVRRTAPTRPHAAVSRRPPGNVLAALPLTVLDRARDVLDQAARARGGRTRRAAAAASRALAAVAGVVEQVPPLRAGEDAQTHGSSAKAQA